MEFPYLIEPTWILLPLLLLISIASLWHTFFWRKGKKMGDMLRLFTSEELAKYDNSNPDLPVYVAIKGTVFDVTQNRAAYPQGNGYGIFAGKDASRALAKSSLKKEDCLPEWSDLPDDQVKVLDDWYRFYEKKYTVVGQIKTEGLKPM